MVLIRPGFSMNINARYIHEQGRFIMLNCDIQGETVDLLNIYAPTSDKDQVLFYTNIKTLIE